MKTNKLSIVALTGMTAIMLISCKKDEVNTPTSSSEATKATISGFAYAEIDQTKPGYEFAPNGTKVIASLDNDTSYYYSGTVTDGKYSISIPVGRNPKNYKLSYENFTATLITADGISTEKVVTFAPIPVTFPLNTFDIKSLIGSENRSNDVYYYVDNNNNDIIRTITINGVARYDNDRTDNGGTEDAFKDMKSNVDGTKVYFTTSTDETYVTTVSNGVYKFSIKTSSLSPDVTGTITFDEFKATQKVSTTINNVTNTETLEKVFTVNATLTLPTDNLYKAGSIINLQTRFTAKP